MNKSTKITLFSLGGVVAAGAVAGAVSIALLPKTENRVNPFINRDELGSTSGTVVAGNTEASKDPVKVESKDGIKIGITPISSVSRDAQQQYELTLFNNDEKGEVNFVDNNGNLILGNKITVVRGQQVHVKVNVKEQYKDTLTVVNFWVYDAANPNYSLGVTKVDENNYHFTLPEGEFADDFYVSGELKASITYGQKKLGEWEFDFKSRHYVYNVTEDNFVYDDVANPNLKMQQYPETGAFVIYSLRLNGHNTIIKNMTIPKNVQFEVLNNIEIFNEQTTSTSPILGFDPSGKLIQNGAAGLWRGVRVTKRTLSEFNWSSWGQDEKVLIVEDKYNFLPTETK
ncbi:MAG: hypothetical protein HDR43_02305 [Mycoplasma sp.]|nr:hypothetical protein [Mycoplasma sp.]